MQAFCNMEALGRVVREEKAPKGRQITHNSGNPDKLLKALPQVCSCRREATLFRVVFILAFGTFKASPQHAFNLTNVQLSTGEMSLHVRYSKMDQKGKGVYVVFKECADECLCPVKKIKASLKIWGQLLGPLFRHQNGSFLKRYQLIMVLT